MISHFISAQGYVGDVMPFWEDGTLHLFYLRAPMEPRRDGSKHLEIAHAVTNDLIHWQELPDALCGDQPYDMFGAHTGSVVRKAPDEYLMFYSGVPDVEADKVPPCGVGLCVARSSDLITWEKHVDNPISTPDLALTDKMNYRDPMVVYWPQEGLYLMTITAMGNGLNAQRGGCVLLKTSRDLVHWSDDQMIWYPGMRWAPECTHLLQVGNRWYLTYQAWDRHAHMDAHVYYVVADNPFGPWHQIDDGRLDGGNQWAGKPVVMGDRILYFANLPTRQGNSDDGDWQWGGHLAYPRELTVQPNGALSVTLAQEVARNLGDDVNLHKARPVFGQWNHKADAWNVSAQGLALAELSVCQEQGFSLKLEIENRGADMAGVVLRMSRETSNRRAYPWTGYEICLDYWAGRLQIRPAGPGSEEHFGPMSEALGSLPMKDASRHRLHVILDGDALEVFLDGESGITTRLCAHLSSKKIGLYVARGSAEIIPFA